MSFSSYRELEDNLDDMGVPKKHKTRSGRDQRRSHHALSVSQLAKCKNCGSPTQPHHACPNCGYYKGRKA